MIIFLQPLRIIRNERLFSQMNRKFKKEKGFMKTFELEQKNKFPIHFKRQIEFTIQ